MRTTYRQTIYLFSLLLMFIPMITMGQVGIGTNSPSASAKLQVDATTQGFLPPRVALTSTSAASNAIASPATGLLVYNIATAGTSPSNVTPGFYYFDGSKWQRIINQQPDATVTFDGTNPNTGMGATNFSGIQQSMDFVYVSNTDNSQWIYNGSAYVTYTPPPSTGWMLSGSDTDAGSNKSGPVFRTGSVTIGGQTSSPVTTVASSAQLEVISTNKGFLPPRMTTAQRDAITSPADGLIIFNTTTDRLEIKTTVSSAATWLMLVTLTGTETLTNKTLTNPILANSNDAVVPAEGSIRYNSASGGILQYSNGSIWNTMTSTVQKSLVTGYFTAGVNYADAFYGDLSCTEVIDLNNDFNGNTFTIPRTGNYTFTYVCAANGNAGSLANGTWEVQVVPSGGQTPAVSVYNAINSFSGFGLNVNGACTLRLTAGSTVTFKLYNGSGFTQGLRTADFNRFSIIEN